MKEKKGMSREQRPWKKRKYAATMGSAEMKKLLYEPPKDDFVFNFTNLEMEDSSDKIKRISTAIIVPVHVAHKGMAKTCFGKENEFGEENEFGFRMLKPFALLPHQVSAVKWQMDREEEKLNGIRGGIMSMHMGLGKTLVALSVIKAKRGTFPSLFLCNKSLLDSISDDCKKFFGNSLPFMILHADYLPKEVTFDTFSCEWIVRCDFVLMTYDTLVQFAKRAGLFSSKKPSRKRLLSGMNFFKIQWHRVIADESQRFVNPKSQIYKSLMNLPMSYRMCLTGTPIKNYEYDLKSQFMFCGFESNLKWTLQSYKILNIVNNILLMSMEDAKIELPKKHTIRLELTFNNNELDVYRSIFAESKSTFSTFSGGNCSFANVLIQFLRLRQVCVSSHLIDNKSKLSNANIENWVTDRKKSGFGSTKFMKINEIIRELPEHDKVLIFSGFTSALSVLQDALHSYGIEKVLMVDGSTISKKRRDIFELFRQDPTYRVLLLSNTVGSVGLNLIEANHVILLEPWWNSVTHEQAVCRAHRIGQLKEVYVWELVMKNSIEQRMLDMCQKKTEMTDQFLNQETLELFLK